VQKERFNYLLLSVPIIFTVSLSKLALGNIGFDKSNGKPVLQTLSCMSSNA
jgi:hypothetical protein